VSTFAALDLYGTTGSARRRRVVLAEFIVGTPVMLALGGYLLSRGGGWWGWWLLGCGLNYAALTAHAVVLCRRGRLAAALAGLDVRAELRRYSLAQAVLFLPGVVAVAALVQLAGQVRSPRPRTRPGE
jgi:hypothetical protein